MLMNHNCLNFHVNIQTQMILFLNKKDVYLELINCQCDILILMTVVISTEGVHYSLVKPALA